MAVLVVDVPFDPDDVLYRYFHPNAMGALVGVSWENDSDLITLIEAQGQETDPVKRQELVWETQRMLLDKVFQVTLVDRASYSAFWNYVHGVNTYPIRAAYNLSLMWLDK